MAKDIYGKSSAVAKLLNGVDLVANTVKQTLGPKGCNIILQKKFGLPISCNDGVTIARDIVLKDRLENAGAQFLIEASRTTNEQAGDGTTTVCVLSQALIHHGFKAIEEGKITATQLVKELNDTIPVLTSMIKELSVPTKTLENLTSVATISCGGDFELGKTVAEAVDKVGDYGVCTSEPGPGTDIKVTFVEGMAFDRGYIVPHFINDPEKMTVKYDEAIVFVTAKHISDQNDLIPIMQLAQQHEKPLLLICEGLSGQALSVALVNAQRGALKFAAVKLPGFSTFTQPMTEDLCALTGAQFFDPYKDLKEVTHGSFGYCQNLEIGSMYTKFITPIDSIAKFKHSIFEKAKPETDLEGWKSILKNAINVRLDLAKSDLKKYQDNGDEWAVTQTQSRIARLGTGAALIQVGARTELEQQERLYRVEDAIQACKAAREEGIVPGAGNIQMRLAAKLQESEIGDTVGAQVVRKALFAIFDQLRVNCESNASVLAAEDQRLDRDTVALGIDPETGDEINLFNKGILDPAKVTRSSLENAISVASIMLRTAGAVVEEPDQPTDKTALQIAEEEHKFNVGQML